MAYILCYGYINSPKILFLHVNLPARRAFRKERGEKLLAITEEARDLVASKPMRGMGF